MAQWVKQIGDLSLLDVRIFITTFVVLSVIAVLLLAWRARPRLQEKLPNALTNVVVVGGVSVYLLLAGATLAFLWKVINTGLIIPNRWTPDTQDGVRVVLTVATLAVAYVVAGVTRQAIEGMTRRHDTLSQHQSQVMIRVAQLSVYVVGFAAVLSVWEVNLTGLLVGAGFLGIVVGMAARQTLGSVLAGFMLMFARPFEIGDWVEIEDREGIVTDISIVNTRIQTFDGEFVMIPNDVVGGSTIINRSRKGRLRLEIDVGVDYETDVERASELAKEAMKEPDDVLSVPSPEVVTKEFADSAVLLGLRFWIDKPSARRKWRARTEVIRAVKTVFDREGVKIPYPQRELSGREETGGFRVAGRNRRELGATADGGEDTEEPRTSGGNDGDDRP